VEKLDEDDILYMHDEDARNLRPVSCRMKTQMKEGNVKFDELVLTACCVIYFSIYKIKCILQWVLQLCTFETKILHSLITVVKQKEYAGLDFHNNYFVAYCVCIMLITFHLC